MNDAATQPMPEYSGYDDEVGVGEARQSNLIYCDIRCGDIAETSKEAQPGFEPVKTVNATGTEYNFFARKHPHLTGHIVGIKWKNFTMKNGTVLNGWNIYLDVKKPKIYVLSIGTKDGPYARLMATLPGVDFLKPIRFVGFMGENKTTHKPQKVLLLSQQQDADGPIWMQPKIESKWLSRLLIDKLKAGITLTDEEERNVFRMPDGKFNKDFPYITQKPDGKWSFDVWESFLFEQMQEFVIPSLADALKVRGYTGPEDVHEEDLQPATPVDVATAPAVLDDDDIPF